MEEWDVNTCCLGPSIHRFVCFSQNKWEMRWAHWTGVLISQDQVCARTYGMNTTWNPQNRGKHFRSHKWLQSFATYAGDLSHNWNGVSQLRPKTENNIQKTSMYWESWQNAGKAEQKKKKTLEKKVAFLRFQEWCFSYNKQQKLGLGGNHSIKRKSMNTNVKVILSI